MRQREQVAKAKDQLVREAKTATEAKYLARLNKQAEAKRAEEVAKPASAAKATSADSAGNVVETTKAAPKAASATKWEPVNVPAPSYTMAARGPRRRVVEAKADFNSAKEVTGVVNPVRPSTAPANVSLDVESAAGDFKPIDLDAVLERRRAAGE